MRGWFNHAISFWPTFTILSAIVFPSVCFAAGRHSYGPIRIEDLVMCGDSATPGVGFSLNPDYGTVALHFKNGSSIAVARVEGSQAYKTFMRNEKPPESTFRLENSSDGILCTLYNSITPAIFQAYLAYCPTSVDPDNDAVQSLLRSLKAAAEAYLGHNICFAQATLPDRHAVDGYLARVVETALHDIGLTQVLGMTSSAHSKAVFSRYLDDLSGPEYLFLVVDYSSYGMNLDLIWQDEGGILPIKRHHSIPRIASAVSAEQLQRKVVREALRNIIEPPFEESPWEHKPVPQLSALVLYGDSTEDIDFQEDLIATFGQSLVSHALPRQPVYAPALGAARQAFSRVNDISYGGEAISWCCLRSWGLGCPTHDQRVEI